MLLPAEDEEQSVTHHRARQVHRVTNGEPRLLTVPESSVNKTQDVPAAQRKR